MEIKYALVRIIDNAASNSRNEEYLRSKLMRTADAKADLETAWLLVRILEILYIFHPCIYPLFHCIHCSFVPVVLDLYKINSSDP